MDVSGQHQFNVEGTIVKQRVDTEGAIIDEEYGMFCASQHPFTLAHGPLFGSIFGRIWGEVIAAQTREEQTCVRGELIASMRSS